MHERLIVIMVAVMTTTLFGCGNQQNDQTEGKRPRPVTVLVLKESRPTRSTLLAGSVSSWKTEKMGFQVAGRVEMVLEPGVNIQGRTVDETGKVMSEGTVIATLEKDRYQLKLASAKAQQETALAKAEAKQSEINNVIPAQIKSAQVAVTLANNNFGRMKQLFEKKAASQSQYDLSLAQLDSAKANLEKIKATVKVEQAELISLNAQVKEANETIKQVQKDLDDTRLISPFNGQVEAVHEIAGGYANAGEQVATIQMMDPIQVEVSVSERTDSQINFNDMVPVYLPDNNKPVEAMVYEKATVADPATRTFRVTLLVRNRRIEVGLPEAKEEQKRPRIRILVHLFTENANRKPPYYVNVKALHKDDSGYYVWKVINLSKGQKESNGSKYQLKKIHVVPGEKRLSYLQVVTMRELTDIGKLDPQNDLLAGPLQAADGHQLSEAEINRDVHENDFIYHIRERWQLRPGDIVRVSLEGEVPKPGFYVPMDSILEKSGNHFVFVTSTTDGKTNVRQIKVHLFDHVRTNFRVEAAGDTPLKAGMQIVASGALFLQDGDPIRISKKVEVQQ